MTNRRTIGILTALLLSASLYFCWPEKQTIHSIAVMPLINNTGDPSKEYLSDGITDSLIRGLSQFPELRVIALTSAFRYKNKQWDPERIGRELNVDALATANITQQSDILTFDLNLIRAGDQKRLLSRQYTNKLVGILSVEEQMASDLKHHLHLKATGSEYSTSDNEAYRLYLKARYFEEKDTAEDYERSLKFYAEAIAKDPNYALAYSGRAVTYRRIITEGLLPPKETWKKFEGDIRKSLDLDKNIAETHLNLAALSYGCYWNWPAAEKEFQQALFLNPNDANAHREYAHYLKSAGRWKEAITQAKLALQLDPLSMDVHRALSVIYYWAGNYEQSITECKRALEMDPQATDFHDLLSDIYARKGMFKESMQEQIAFLKMIEDQESAERLSKDYREYGYTEARQREFQEALEISQQQAQIDYVPPMRFVFLYIYLGQKDQAFEWLEKAYDEKSPWLVFLKTDPAFDPLRSDARFSRLIQRVGIP